MPPKFRLIFFNKLIKKFTAYRAARQRVLRNYFTPVKPRAESTVQNNNVKNSKATNKKGHWLDKTLSRIELKLQLPKQHESQGQIKSILKSQTAKNYNPETNMKERPIGKTDLGVKRRNNRDGNKAHNTPMQQPTYPLISPSEGAKRVHFADDTEEKAIYIGKWRLFDDHIQFADNDIEFDFDSDIDIDPELDAQHSKQKKK